MKKSKSRSLKTANAEKRPAKRASKRVAKLPEHTKRKYTAKRTRKILVGPKSATLRTPKKLQMEEQREAIYELRLQGHSLYDIGEARNLSVSRVCEILKEVYERKVAINDETLENVRTLDLERIDRMILSWYARARVDTRASETYHMWLDKRHKLLGLNINRTELSGAGGGPLEINASRLDLSKLSDEQLGWLEVIMQVAGPQSDESVIAEMPLQAIAAPADA